MVITTARSWWAEPRAPHAPRRVWRDWALVAVIIPTATLEAALREDVTWRLVAWLFAVSVSFALLWRRSQPLAATAVAFGAASVVNAAAMVAGVGSVGLNTSIYVLLFPYALLRWGSGREAGLGLGIMLVAYVLGITADFVSYGEAAMAGLVLMLPAMLGAAVRYRESSRLRELDQVKLRERAELARELHDTVAHHVSAIAIRAQAGQLLGRSDGAAATDALAVIEEEASRTLAEMRTMVGGLRDGDAAALGPQPGVGDLERLANQDDNDGPRVVIDRSGDLDDVPPAIGSAVFRIVQESVTNARRHARDATRIAVSVVGDADVVRVTVRDDGGTPARHGDGDGYGLVGMSERAALLGGSLEAGPDGGAGWTVSAVLPRDGRST